jgi:methionyl-tRNA synthetase
MYNLAESLRIVTILLNPVMPVKTAEAWKQLGFDSDIDSQTLEHAKWGMIKDGHRIRKGDPVFPRRSD